MTNPLHLDEDQIHQYFEDVYESLQAEHGFGLDPDTLDDAKRHVLLYWRKLRDRIANRVTETEVPLTLMNQRTPGNRLFSIHGVIDVVEENDQVTLYDIKSHELHRIHENHEQYAPQLEVYAHIWNQLRGQVVNQTCIISTNPPDNVKGIYDYDAMTDAERTAYEQWDPVVPIAVHNNRMSETIRQFGEVVDKIESRQFTPPTVEQLRGLWRNRHVQMICSKCDGRYSCDGYRRFAEQVGGTSARTLTFYLDHGMSRDEYDVRLDAQSRRPIGPSEDDDDVQVPMPF